MESSVLTALPLVVAVCGFAAWLDLPAGKPASPPVPPGPRRVHLECSPDDLSAPGSSGPDRRSLTHVRASAGTPRSGSAVTVLLLCHIVN